jgi:GxxExxY protein
MELLHQELTDKIIRTFYFVYNELGYGYLEKVYERALVLELSETGMDVKQQQQVKVFYKSRPIGDYYADLLVNDAVVIEIKAVETLAENHKRQLQNYLKATTVEVGLLLNFGPAPQVIRKVFTNTQKR